MMNRIRSLIAALLLPLIVLAYPTSEVKAQSSQDTMILASTQAMSYLNQTMSTAMGAMVAGTQLFASPVLLTETLDPKPYLAKSWSLSDDKLNLTLHLVNNAKFHDGQPVTAKDVTFSIETVRKYHPAGKILFDNVVKVDAPDQYTAILRMSKPDPVILLKLSQVFTPIMPEHVYKDVDMRASDLNRAGVVGSGPFKVAEFDPKRILVLNRVDNFFMGSPKLKQVIIRVMPSEINTLLALERGEADLIQVTSPTAVQRIKGMKNVTLSESGYEALSLLNLVITNTKSKYLGDKRVRQALMYAMDRNEIVSKVQEGVARVDKGPLSLGSPFYSSFVEKKYPYDLEKANQLLDEAGFKKDGKGNRFELALMFMPGVDAYGQNPAQLLVQQWKKLGINVKLTPSPDFPTMVNKIGNYDFDLALSILFNWMDPTIGVNRSYLCENIRKGSTGVNESQYCNKNIDKILIEATSEVDKKKRTALYAEFQDLITEDVPLLYMSEVYAHNAYRSGLTNPPNGITGLIYPFISIEKKN